MAHILSFHAHPDDLEMLASGTLALLASKGHRVTIATMTAGDCGSAVMSREEAAVARRREATAAAAIIGAAYDCAGVPDFGVFNDDATRRKAVEMIRRHAPDVVLGASTVDYHPDHEAAGILVRDACFAVTIKNYETGPAPLMAAIPHLYMMDPIGGRDREGVPVQASFAVDVSPFIETKKKMLACHESQFAWVAKQHGTNEFLDSLVRWSAKRGKAYGVAYAEGFRHYRGTPYPTSPLLQELVGDALIANPA